jgi:hypothetical protein
MNSIGSAIENQKFWSFGKIVLDIGAEQVAKSGDLSIRN